MHISKLVPILLVPYNGGTRYTEQKYKTQHATISKNWTELQFIQRNQSIEINSLGPNNLWISHDGIQICICGSQLRIIKNIYSGAKKVFSQPPIVQVLPLKKMREACNFHHRYTSTMTDKIRK